MSWSFDSAERERDAVSLSFRWGLILLGVLIPGSARAESALSAVYPNGGQRGTTIELKLSGTELPDSGTLFVEGEGIRAPGPFVKGAGKIEIAPDAAPGVRQLRLVGPKGATSPRPFAVGALPEALEKEPNDRPEQAERVGSLPITLNGALTTRPDIDSYRVSLKKGECLVAAGESRSLGAPTNLVVRIRDLGGRELLVQMDHRTRDPLLGFVASEAGEYLVELQEVMNNYSNLDAAYVYRLTLTTGPWIDTVFPPGAQAGTTAHLTFRGWNLGGASGPSTATADVPIPPDAPPGYSVSAGGAGNAASLRVGHYREQNETEGAGSTPEVVALPVTLNGEFGARGDRDAFQIHARSGERLSLDVDAREIGSFADAALTLLDPSGKVLATADDSDRGRDPRLLWTCPADGAYTVLLRDIAGGSRGGPGFFYRLTIAPPEPSLRLTTTAHSPVLKAGEKLTIPVTVNRGFLPGPIRIRAEGLPEGVTVEPVEVAGSPSGTSSMEVKLVLSAVAEVKPGFAAIRIVAAADGVPPTAALATWVLATDRSGTLATGSTDRLLLVVPAP